MEFSIKKKKEEYDLYIIVKNIHFFLKWIFLFNFPSTDPRPSSSKWSPFSSCTIYSKKKKNRPSPIRVPFHKKPVCNLIKREVPTNPQRNRRSISPIFPFPFFQLPLARNSIVRIETQKQRNRPFVHTVHLRVFLVS